MGRYDFRAQRIYNQTSQLLRSGRIERRPAWFEVVNNNPPPQILARPRPLEHSGKSRRKAPKKPSKGLFHPREIRYPEDELRSRFFQDHPWELARPRMLLENDGVNGTETWDHIRQEGRALGGESVVQRQMFLMDNHGMTREEAYDQARSELYAERMQEDVERRVAREEALHVGAQFGKDKIAIGMELEDKAFESWRKWAAEDVTRREQARVAGFVDQAKNTEDAVDDSVGEEELELAEAEATTETTEKNDEQSAKQGTFTI